MTACVPPSSKNGLTLLHLLAQRTWKEYGEHNWDRYEELVRVSTAIAATFPGDEGLDHRTSTGKTALMAAASVGNYQVAFELVNNGADVNAVLHTPGKPDRTAMDLASCAKRGDIAKLLKSWGGEGLCQETDAGGGYQQREVQQKRARRRR